MTDLERLLEYLPEQHWSQEIVAVHLEEDAANLTLIAQYDRIIEDQADELATLREAVKRIRDLRDKLIEAEGAPESSVWLLNQALAQFPKEKP